MSSNSPRVKKPHYVQQSYLAGFSNDGHIHVFDKSLRRQFTSHIRDICSERSFYDLEGMEELTGKEQQLESFFHGFEDAGVKVIRDNIGSIRDGAFTTLPQSERIDLALFLAVQHLRTKRTREIAGSLLESISKDAFLDHMRRTQPDFPIEDWLSVDADERARFAAHFYLVTNEDVRVAVSGLLHNRCWVFLHNDTGGSFYTSDHPIVEHGDCSPSASATAVDLARDVAGKFDAGGLFQKILPSLLLSIFAMGARVCFPLAPDVILMLLDREQYAKGVSLDGQVQRMRDACDPEYYNSLQVLQSYRQVYSKDSDFALATRLVQ